MKKYFCPDSFKKIFTITIVLFLSSKSSAYMSLSETAELIKADEYRVGLAPQLLLSNGGGSNVGAFFDMSVDKDINSRFTIGSGKTDFWAGASAKWVPYPDFENQPALGLKAAFIYTRLSTLNFYNLQVTPIISKIVTTQFGKMNPYIGVPLTFIYNTNNTTTAAQFVIGAEWIDRDDFQIGGEFDLSLTNATNAVTLHFNFPFNEKTGYKK